MFKNGYGKIINTINTASMSALIVPHPQKQAYNVSKAGVVALTKTLAAEWPTGECGSTACHRASSAPP